MVTATRTTSKQGAQSAETLPAVVRRHRRQRQLDRAMLSDQRWRVTPDGWTLPGSGFEIDATGDKVRDHGYRVLKDSFQWASFASPEEAMWYVSWRADQTLESPCAAAPRQ